MPAVFGLHRDFAAQLNGEYGEILAVKSVAQECSYSCLSIFQPIPNTGQHAKSLNGKLNPVTSPLQKVSAFPPSLVQ